MDWLADSTSRTLHMYVTKFLLRRIWFAKRNTNKIVNFLSSKLFK